MSQDNKAQSDFHDFVELVQSKISVQELYTKLTGEQFEMVASRNRAKIVWREDKSPSLSYYAEKNILTDFTTTNKNGEYNSYGPIALLLKCGGALSWSHAFQMACEMTETPIPDTFQKRKEDGTAIAKREYFAGTKLAELWDACKEYLYEITKDPAKRPTHITKFFEKRNIPFDLEFLKAINIGVFPDIEVIRHILKDTDIMKPGKGRDLDIFNEKFCKDAIIFPLYTINGALAGFRARQLTVKEFKQWQPLDSIQCFYNMDKFNQRPINRRIIGVEGEMNLVAYAIAVYNEVKNKGNVYNDVRGALPIIYATGSKGNCVDIFESQVDKFLYIQDNDVKDFDEVPDPLKHPLVLQCLKIANQIKANDLLVMNWDEVKYATGKYDLEDFIAHNGYTLSSMRDLPTLSFPRYCFNSIRNYVNTIDNPDNKRENQIKFSFAIADKLQVAQRDVFNEIAEKEFSLSTATVSALKSNDRGFRSGPFTIDELGRITEDITTDNGIIAVPRTNFYLKISNETYYYNLDNKCKKTYTVQICISGKKPIENEIDSDDAFGDKEILKFISGQVNITEMKFYEPSWAGKEFANVTGMMREITNPNTSYVFTSLGRPSEEKTHELFGTNKFFLMPDVSVIGGEVLENKGFKINIDNEDAVVKTKFKFKKVDDDEFREVASLFWNHVRHIHEPCFTDTCVAVVFDSCTREIQGTGVVENDHGFPLYLSGQSGSYKSTAALAGMCLLGDFINYSDFLGCDGTVLAWTHQLQLTGTATHCLDDLKVEDLRSKDFVSMFQNIYGSPTRVRMDSSGTNLKGGQKLRASAIFTSEAKPSDLQESTAARMLCLRMVKPQYNRTQEWWGHLELMKAPKDDGSCNFHRMSAFLPRIVAWAQKRDIKPYAKALDKWKKHYTDIIRGKGNNIERPIDMVSRIIAAWEQITEFCKEKEICPPQEADQAFTNLVEFWDVKIVDQINRIEAHSSKFKIIDVLVQIIKSEGIGIKYFRDGKWQPNTLNRTSGYPIKDITYPDERGRKLIIVSPRAVIQAMNNFMETTNKIVEDKFREDLKESGVIETDINGKLVHYPIPNEINNQINEKDTKANLAIDYNLLMKRYEGLSK